MNGGGRRQRFEWGFGGALAALAALGLWAELVIWLVRSVRSAEGAARWIWALGFFLAVLPLLALCVYRFELVFAFFRSVRVGVVNLILIGLGSIIGVLWHQEDPNFPIPQEGMRQLERWEQLGPTWPQEARRAYDSYVGGPNDAGFRNAHAFFLYKLLHGRGFHLLPGVARDCALDRDAIERQMDNLRARLPQLRDRFGEEFAVAMEARSERGLHTRGENGEIADFERRWDDFFWTLFVWSNRLDLIRVYKSGWFALLWTVLFFGVLSNLFRGGARRLLRPAKWGFAVTHGGALLVILGAAWGRLREERGRVDLNVGDVSAGFQLYRGGQRSFSDRSLLGTGEPFAVRLDAFHADYFDVVDVIYARLDESGQPQFEFALDRQPKVRVHQGQQLSYDYGPAPPGRPDAGRRIPWLRLEVLEYMPKAQMRAVLRAAGAEERPALPLARLSVDGPGGSVERILASLFDLELPLVHPGSGTRVRFSAAASADAARADLAQPVETRYGVLRLQPEAPGLPETLLEAQPGARHPVRVGGQDYTVEVLRAVPRLRPVIGADGRMRQAEEAQPIEYADPVFPAALVRIAGPDGRAEERWVVEEHFHPERAFLFDQVQLRFEWDRWRAPAVARWVVFQLPDGSLLCGKVGEPDSLEPIALHTPRALGDGATLVVHEAYRQGMIDRVPEALRGVDFFHPAPPAVRMRAVTPQWSREFWLSGEPDAPAERLAYVGPDGADRLLFLRLREDLEDLPVEWRSKLSMLVADPAHGFREEATGEIRVNDYFTFGGYRFFQTNANPNDPTYSGVGVVYDPGIEMVLAGLYLVAAGTIVVFLVRPLLERRRKEA